MASSDQLTPDVSIVLPVYFNEGNLASTLESLKSAVVDKQYNKSFELIFVDDGSGDHSLEILLNLQRAHPDLIRVIKFTRNFGQVSALQAGMAHARGRFIVSMSADGQDPPELINDMLDAHGTDGYDVVICTREGRDESIGRVATSRFFYWMMRKLSFPNMPEGGFDYVSMSRRALNVFLANPEAHPFFQGRILWMGFKTKMIPYRRRARSAGTSRWTFRKKLTYLIDGVLSYSYVPMRLMSVFGFGFAAFGFLYAVLIMILRLAGGIPIQGWAPLMVIVLVMGGIQMVMTGVIGEYLWRTLAQVRNRPPYVIDKIYDCTPIAHATANRTDH